MVSTVGKSLEAWLGGHAASNPGRDGAALPRLRHQRSKRPWGRKLLHTEGTSDDGGGPHSSFAPSRSRQLTPCPVWRLLKIAQFLKCGYRGRPRGGETDCEGPLLSLLFQPSCNLLVKEEEVNCTRLIRGLIVALLFRQAF